MAQDRKTIRTMNLFLEMGMKSMPIELICDKIYGNHSEESISTYKESVAKYIDSYKKLSSIFKSMPVEMQNEMPNHMKLYDVTIEEVNESLYKSLNNPLDPELDYSREVSKKIEECVDIIKELEGTGCYLSDLNAVISAANIQVKELQKVPHTFVSDTAISLKFSIEKVTKLKDKLLELKVF